VPIARIAAAANRRALHRRTKKGWSEIGVVKKTEASEHVHFVADIPVDLGIDRVPIKREAARRKVVIVDPREVRLGKQGIHLLCDLRAR